MTVLLTVHVRSLKASHNRWLVVKDFGNTLTAAAGIMKKEQIFFLEAGGKDAAAMIRTHLGRYLRSDGDRKFRGHGEQGDEEDQEIFQLEPQHGVDFMV